MSKQIIIAAFPCSGKSFLLKNSDGSHKIVGLDEDIHNVNHIDYVKRIEDNKDADVLLITAHELAINFLNKQNLDYVLVYPEDTKECRDEWYRRSKERKTMFLGYRIKVMWKSILESLRNDKNAKAHYTLKANEHLSDIIDHIIEEQSSQKETDSEQQ